MIKVEKDPKQDLNQFMDTESFWVIWQVGRSPRGDKRIRQISQVYHSQARAEADAERYRKSGVVTWVEEARPLAPSQVPQAAVDALWATTTPVSTQAVAAISIPGAAG
jgi:hypothetical protein